MLLKRNFLKDYLLSLWIFVLSIPFTFLFPIILVIIAMPVKLYRRLIMYIAYVTDPFKGVMITGISAAQIRDIDEIYTKPRSAEVTCLRLKGPLDYDKIIEAFSTRVIMKQADDKPYPTAQYPELKQYFTKFLGYVFFRTDLKFDVRNHFTFYESQSTSVTRRDLLRIWEELMIKPFAKNRSPWEFVLVDNYVPDKDELEAWNSTGDPRINSTQDHYWVAFLRTHHGLADGFSVQRMLSYLADEVFMPKFSTNITPFQSFIMHLRTVSRGPYDVLWRWYRGREDYHSLHLPASKKSGEYHVIESKLISTQRVKDIKTKFGVPFTTVLIAAISGGMRKYFLKYGVTIPEYLSAAIPLATSDHSDKITNEFLLATVEYAVNMDDPKKRIEYVQEKIKILTTTAWISMLNIIIDVHASFPHPVFMSLTNKAIYSSTYSTQPGPVKCMTGFGSILLEVNYSYGCGPDSCTYGISTLTYNGFFRMVLFIDKNAVESRAVAEDIVEFISEEFEVLERYPQDPDSKSKEERHKLNWRKSIKYD